MAETIKAWAPGRVNLIGEHTDHTGGFVLPIATEQGVTIECERYRAIELSSDLFGDTGSISPGASGHQAVGWVRYVAAVATELELLGRPSVGIRGRIMSDLPVGGGVSSSAALEVAVAFALCQAADFDIDRSTSRGHVSEQSYAPSECLAESSISPLQFSVEKVTQP